jgi:hypothetical protein
VIIFRKKAGLGHLSATPDEVASLDDVGGEACRVVMADGREFLVEGDAVALGMALAEARGVEPVFAFEPGNDEAGPGTEPA